MARKRMSGRTRLRWLAALLLAVLIGAGFGWWHLHHWQPPRSEFPVQGVEIGETDGPSDWTALKAIGADFAYLDASAGAFARDPAFAANLEAARKAGLRVGAVHRYDPCQPAGPQSANFVTVVPRDPKLLPPAVELDQTAEDCLVRVSDQAVESELMTFLNQIETHTGKAALLKVTRGFERRYRVAARLDRNLWVVADRFQPDYAGRPWSLWTANGALDTEASDRPVRWVVLQP
jgi:lysozyme